MPNYYAYNPDAKKPMFAEQGGRIRKPTGGKVVSQSSVAPAGYVLVGQQQTSNKAGDKTYNIFAPAAAPAPTPTPTPTPTPAPVVNTPAPQQTAPPVNPYQSTFDDYDTKISDLTDTISSLTDSSTKALQNLSTQMAAEREEAAKAMEEMQQRFAQSMTQQSRPRVEGIRFATTGTGGASQQQLQRRGTRGTFGRGGDRLMKISALNV